MIADRALRPDGVVVVRQSLVMLATLAESWPSHINIHIRIQDDESDGFCELVLLTQHQSSLS
jgi:hypothetical protein